MEEYISLINNVGFPIAVALFFMVRVEKVIKANTEAFRKITAVITDCQRIKK